MGDSRPRPWYAVSCARVHRTRLGVALTGAGRDGAKASVAVVAGRAGADAGTRRAGATGQARLARGRLFKAVRVGAARCSRRQRTVYGRQGCIDNTRTLSKKKDANAVLMQLD